MEQGIINFAISFTLEHNKEITPVINFLYEI